MRNFVAAAFSRLILCQAPARDNALLRALQTMKPRTNVRPTNLDICENKSRTCNSHIIVHSQDNQAADLSERIKKKKRISTSKAKIAVKLTFRTNNVSTLHV